MAQMTVAAPTRFASASDHAECRRLHRKHGKTYYLATQRFPEPLRQHTHAVYGFVRVPDEWVDNPEGTTQTKQLELLADWRRQLREGIDGIQPTHPVMRAFVDTVTRTSVSPCEAAVFISAMETDITKTTYADYAELQGYMRGSAAAVGVMMLQLMVPRHSSDQYQAAKMLGEAMQLTNFLRDIDEDWRERQRIYMPLDELAEYGVDPDQIRKRRFDSYFRKFMEFQVERARSLYLAADPGIASLPKEGQVPVLMARILYAMILDKIAEQGYNPFAGRASTGKLEKLSVAIRLAANPASFLSP